MLLEPTKEETRKLIDELKVSTVILLGSVRDIAKK